MHHAGEGGLVSMAFLPVVEELATGFHSPTHVYRQNDHEVFSVPLLRVIYHIASNNTWTRLWSKTTPCVM